MVEATLTQPSTHTVPGTVLTAQDKDSCILSCGNSSDTNKYRDFTEEESSLQEELMKKFLSNSFLLSACFVPVCATPYYVLSHLLPTTHEGDSYYSSLQIRKQGTER